MKRRIFKLAPRIALFLLLGAIFNVAVAWAEAACREERFSRNAMPNATQGFPIIGSGPSRPDDLVNRIIVDFPVRQAWPMGAVEAAHSSVSSAWLHENGHANLAGVSVNWAGIGPYDELRLPTNTLWPGFVINTVFYAAILWLLFAFPFVLRRCRRIKRGLCPACAYPIGTSDVCTECGKAVKA
jgi:hypothetical protein